MMRTNWTKIAMVFTLLAGFGLLSVRAQDAKVVDSVTKLADKAASKTWRDAMKDGEAVAKSHELLDIMTLFKLRKPTEKTSGIGIGAKPGAISPDGIEAKIMGLSKKVQPADLGKNNADLIRMTEIVGAIAAATYHQCPNPEKMGAKDPKKWKEWQIEMLESSQELGKALKAKNADNVKKAANRLNGTCTDCHGTFRDS